MMGPFGLWMGMGLSDICGDVEELAPFKYRIYVVPKPHSAFDFYVLKVTPDHGLSWIKAVGKNVKTSCYGIELKSAFESMLARLSKVYGEADVSDFLMYESIWSEPRDWMQALEKGERVLLAKWGDDQSVVLKDHIKFVWLTASAVNDELGYISVEYEFNNGAAADSEIFDMEDDAL